MAPQSCPTIDVLEQFLLGKSPRTEQVAVADHLLVCTCCARVVETVTAIDELTLALSNQSSPTNMDAEVPQLAKAIAIAQELKSEWI